MDYNFHTHTERCRHATGSDEEYVQRAIEAGIKHLGFSDHAPFVFPDGYDSGYRVPMDEAKGYVSDLHTLREKYKDKIKIHIGFEMEYYPAYFDKMLEIASNVGAEYLILGQHFIFNEHPGGIGAAGPTDSEEYLRTYVDEVIAGMKTGVFSYVAHPDLVYFTGDKKIYRREMTRLCHASKEYSIPLEINLIGIREQKHYPSDDFWEIAGNIGSPVTFGTDAHNSEAFLNKGQILVAEELVNKCKLNYCGRPPLLSINKK